MRILVAVVIAAAFGLAGPARAQERPQAVAAARDEARPSQVRVPGGTEITLRMAQSLDSKHAVMGERVELAVAEDVAVDGWVVVPKDTRVLGTVVTGKKKEKAGNAHDVALEIDYVAMGDRHVLLAGDRSARGRTGKDTMVASTVLFGLSGYLLARNARTATIPEGTILTGWVAEDIDLPPIRPAAK